MLFRSGPWGYKWDAYKNVSSFNIPPDAVGWDAAVNNYEYLIDKNYSGNANSSSSKLEGRNKSDMTYHNDGQELARMHPSDSVIIDVDHNGTEIQCKIRMYQYLDIAGYFILDDTITTLKQNITTSTQLIELTNVNLLPDASVDNIQYIWISNEKIGYTIKTQTGISGLMRGAHGTSNTTHSTNEPVYPETAKTVIVKPVPLKNINLVSYFLNDDEFTTLDNSTNAIAAAVRNYISS